MVSPRYRVNSPDVIDETIDGETVVIHLGTGDYYSLNGTATCAWTGIEQHADTEEIVDLLQSSFVGDRAPMELAVLELLRQLLAEGLIVSVDGERLTVGEPAPPAGSARRPFEAPTVEKYTDMQDLIQLDPVHEVGEMGWPQPAPAGLGPDGQRRAAGAGSA